MMLLSKKCTHSQPFLPNARRRMFFSIPVCHHTHIGSEEKSRFSFLCSYLALIFFNSFELFLRHFQSGCNLPSFEPSSALIGRSSNCICNMGLGYVSISRGSVQVLLASGHWIALDRSMVKWQVASGSFMGVYLSHFFSNFPKKSLFFRKHIVSDFWGMLKTLLI